MLGAQNLIYYNIIIYMNYCHCSSAEIRKDVSSQYHNSLYTGDVAERIKILKSVGQGQLSSVLPLCHSFH